MRRSAGARRGGIGPALPLAVAAACFVVVVVVVVGVVVGCGGAGCVGGERDARSGNGGFDPSAAQRALEGGDAAAALERAEAAVDAAAPGAAPHDLARDVEALALAFHERGFAAESETLFLRALALREPVAGDDLAATASLLHDLSGLAFNRGDLAAAEERELRSIALRERAGAPDDPALAAARRDLGFVYLAQGRLAEAEPLLTEALRALQARGAEGDDAWFEVALAEDYLATLRRTQGEHAEAARLYEELLPQVTERLGEDHPHVAYVTNNLAGVYRDLERFDRAETLLHRSLALRRARQPPDPAALATALLNLAELYRMQGKREDAEPLYVDALAQAAAAWPAESGERLEFVNQYAVLLREAGRPDEAEPYAREALALARAALGEAHPRVAQSELDFAELLRARGRDAEALDHAERALAIRRDVLGDEHPETALARLARAGCLQALPGGAAEARAELDRAVERLRDAAAYPASAADALALRAGLRRASEPAAARADLVEALAALERLRPTRGGGERVRAEFLGDRADGWRRLARWEVEDGSPERGFLAAERGRARALLDQLAAARVGDDTPRADAGAAAALRDARRVLAEARARIAFAETREDRTPEERAAELARLGERLDAASAAFRAAYDRVRNADPAWRSAVASAVESAGAIRAGAVPAGGLLLSWAVGDDGAALFVVPPPPAAIEARPLALDPADARLLGVEPGALTRAKLERAIRAPAGVLGALTAPAGAVAMAPGAARGIGGVEEEGGAPLAPRLAALHRALVPPALEPRLLAATEIALVPDGPLLALPFEALIVRAGSYWLDAAPPLRYGPSATFLAELARGAERGSGRGAPSAAVSGVALSVSDPDYGDGPGAWPRLPATARETDALRAALGSARVVALQRAAAREPAVRAALAGKRWIHLATHGLAGRAGDDLFAALAVTPPPAIAAAPDTDDDGLLELHEIYALRLDADLAVLSACGTNAGRAVSGEGVFALSRGFLVAGARRVVASQWAVDDEATAELVGALFRELGHPGRAGEDAPGAAAALRDAKREVRATPRWEHPYFWAPLVLTGPD